MPGDPKQCREHAKRCWALASEITNPVLKESLTDAAQRWAVLAAELETIHSLLEALEEPRRGWAKPLGISIHEVPLRQLHEEPVTATPAPAVTLNADRRLPVREALTARI